MSTIQEVLSRPGYEKLPLCKQEFYEIDLYESADPLEPGFNVSRGRYVWNASIKSFLFAEWVSEHSATIEAAKEVYEEWRKVIVSRGFSQSDMDL